MEDKLYIPSTEAGIELRISLTEIDRLKIKSDIIVLASSIYDKTINSSLSEERKKHNYDLALLLLNAKKLIEHFEEVDMKRQSRNFELINRCKQKDLKINELIKENEYLKERIPV